MNESNQKLKLVPLPNDELYNFEEVSIFSPTLPNFIKEIILKSFFSCILTKRLDSNNQIISLQLRVLRPILTTAFAKAIKNQSSVTQENFSGRILSNRKWLLPSNKQMFRTNFYSKNYFLFLLCHILAYGYHYKAPKFCHFVRR